MRELINKFLKNKLNITLLVIQAIALICLVFSSLSVVFNVLFLLLESCFFILWGISNLLMVTRIRNRNKDYSMLPYTKEQLDTLAKRDMYEIKNTKFKGIMLLILGVFLLFTTIFAII